MHCERSLFSRLLAENSLIKDRKPPVNTRTICLLPKEFFTIPQSHARKVMPGKPWPVTTDKAGKSQPSGPWRETFYISSYWKSHGQKIPASNYRYGRIFPVSNCRYSQKILASNNRHSQKIPTSNKMDATATSYNMMQWHIGRVLVLICDLCWLAKKHCI
jgi:hypothetical protein